MQEVYFNTIQDFNDHYGFETFQKRPHMKACPP